LRFETDAAQAEAWSDALLDLGALSVDLSDPHIGTDKETPQYGEPGMPGEVLWPTVRIDALFPQPFPDSINDGNAGTETLTPPRNDSAPPLPPSQPSPKGGRSRLPSPSGGGLGRGQEGARLNQNHPKALTAALTKIAAALSCPLPLFEIAPIAERDWVRETQSQFGPIAVTDDFWIVPTWSTPPTQASHLLRLDPGLAFGTGSHPTTLLCLRWLREHVRPADSVLDYGCGSGILLLAARLFDAGANGAAFGTDIDPQALIASRENAAANRLDARFVAPEQLPERTFDLVIANILANPLRALAPLLAGRAAIGGRLILSGVLEEQQEELCACYEPWFEIAPWQTLDGWVLLAGIRVSGIGDQASGIKA
jgi:ribosomal protein L11 methyltransferase